jgi:hypothetical protein
VLRLVGAHLTNAQIGNRLVISVWTVESHVSSLLRKLDPPPRIRVVREGRDGLRGPEGYGAAVISLRSLLLAAAHAFCGRSAPWNSKDDRGAGARSTDAN